MSDADFDERVATRAAWSLYREAGSVPVKGVTTAHRAFVAGWKAAQANLKTMQTFEHDWTGIPQHPESRRVDPVAREILTTNRLLVALIDQLTTSARWAARTPEAAQAVDIGIRAYLPAEDWERLEGQEKE